MKMTKYPLIKPFLYKGKYYVYDTNRNRLMNITKELFLELNILINIGIDEYRAIETKTVSKQTMMTLLDKGYFSPSGLKQLAFPHTEYIEELLNRSLSSIILQVTQDRNFDCRYCSFAGSGVYNRVHRNAKMSELTAKAAIDFLLQRNIDTDRISITFYGGEPFLEFGLIMECVKYVHSKVRKKELLFNATINGSILNDDIAMFLEENSFDLLISLDGPESIQNNNRKYRHSGNNTYVNVLKNINSLREKHSGYFEEHVSFNAVVLDRTKLPIIEDFFLQELKIQKEKVKIQYADLSGVDYLLDSSVGLKEDEGDYYTQNGAFADIVDRFSDFYEILSQRNALPPVWHHNGPCYPGLQRLFISCDGTFFPCEKASEKCTCLTIGNLKRGFDYENIQSLLRIGALTEKECSNCWARRFCDICAVKCVDYETDSLSRERKLYECKAIKYQTLNRFKKLINKEDNK